MTCSRQTLLSSLALVAVILTVSTTGALAQPSDEPAGSHPAWAVSFDEANPGQPHGRHSVEFLNDCGDVDNCPDTPNPVREDGDGEGVADALQISTIIITKNADPADGTDFPFSSDLGAFTLDDADPDDGDAFGDSLLFEVAPSVDQAFIEQAPLFWDLHSIVCTYSDINTTVAAIRDNGSLVGVTIGPAPEDEVTCTFNNQKGPVNSVYLPFAGRNYLSP
jgi:hypothetical protein